MASKENKFIKTLRFHGVSKRELGTELNLSQPTIKSYCDNPQMFRLNQLENHWENDRTKLDRIRPIN